MRLLLPPGAPFLGVQLGAHGVNLNGRILLLVLVLREDVDRLVRAASWESLGVVDVDVHVGVCSAGVVK